MPSNSKRTAPSGYFDKGRTIGFFGNINIGWDNRYIADFSLRTDGSSRFGRDNQFAPFWSVGLAWNVNREKFWTGTGSMKIRASVGSVGSSKFSADQALTRFVYNSDGEYNGIYGAELLQYGNTALKWQNTLKYNLGFGYDSMEKHHHLKFRCLSGTYGKPIDGCRRGPFHRIYLL